jgi:acetyl esterase/lipase
MMKVSLILAAILVGLFSSSAVLTYQNANAAEIILPTTNAKYEVSSEDVVYAKPDGLDLLARIYRPKLLFDKPLHAVIDVHPGAWNFYDRLAGRLYNNALAASGLVVVAIDFRQGPTFKHPLASRDVAAAVRFVRVNAEKLGIDADRIGLIGSSAGGHLALLAGIKPNVHLNILCVAV